jgi:crotonobetainyl-CoA:carnitine CoA-transferase CaiB-like acyl-CoA transferase
LLLAHKPLLFWLHHKCLNNIKELSKQIYLPLVAAWAFAAHSSSSCGSDNRKFQASSLHVWLLPSLAVLTLLDFQFELLTTYHSSGKLPKRSKVNNGHPLLHAPYGIHATTDSHIAIAMVDIKQLAKAIGCNELMGYDQKVAFSLRDEIKTLLAKHLSTQPSSFWLEKLHAKDLWAMEVLDWERLTKLDAYKCLQMEQTLTTSQGQEITTTRCPIRINGERIFSPKPAPQLGEHNEKINKELILTANGKRET